jgi:hypothetical protein
MAMKVEAAMLDSLSMERGRKEETRLCLPCCAWGGVREGGMPAAPVPLLPSTITEPFRSRCSVLLFLTSSVSFECFFRLSSRHLK